MADKLAGPDHPAEREAEAVAGKVMSMRASEAASSVQLKADDMPMRMMEPDEEDDTLQLMEDDEEEPIQAHAEPGGATAANGNPMAGLGGGQPLPAPVRAFFEPRFGRSFADVRIHDGVAASNRARSINAQAFTYGRNIVFNRGRYSPDTERGRHLLAHELTHVVQQGRAGNEQATIQRFVDCESGEDCPDRERGERARSRSQPMELFEVTSGGVGRLLANFAIGDETVRGDLTTNPDWNAFVAAMIANPNITWAISGFTDCKGSEGLNTNLRAQRATSLYLALPPDAQAQVDGYGGAALSDCIRNNATEENRSLNRSALIMQASVSHEFEPLTVNPDICGPSVTNWLLNQMNINQNHPVIRTGREHRWPRWVPVFNIGWTVAALKEFADLVGPGRPWDFKRTQRWWRASEGGPCPTESCDRTVTLCGHCVNYDVPGNIHFGWVGRRMELRPSLLHFGAGRVQEGTAGSDDPPDTVAINIGIAMADEGKGLCDEVNAKYRQLNLEGTEDCTLCGEAG